MTNKYWIEYKWDKDGCKSLYSEHLYKNDIFRMPHKSRDEAEYWISRIADGINLVKEDFYIIEDDN